MCPRPCGCGEEWTELAEAPTQSDSLVAQNVRKWWLRMGPPGLAAAGVPEGLWVQQQQEALRDSLETE